MLIEQTYYYVGLITFIALIVGVTYILGRKKNKAIFSFGILLAISLFVTNKWIFPNVYLITACGQCESKILLIPATTPSGYSLKLGKHCYLLNESDSVLSISTHFYGDRNEINSVDKIINESVPSHSSQQFSTVALDYLFEQPDKSVRTKQEGAIKYSVSCIE